ncbi:uncharacterized protein G2W53_036726 [Senna tora]|uniref:Zinc finger PHD-type domain-containing protein n=1 Tax=Senna tora TaxID=362788 RepID=A0A834SUZ9_9FABA|nr:uncharacterized protein G2W53_036726 [Senna tora]
MTIGNYNADFHRKDASCSLASIDFSPAFGKNVNEILVLIFSFASTPFEPDNGNYHDVQNFVEELPMAGVVLPNSLDLSDISFLKYFCNSAISLKGEPSVCSGEQVESSLATVSLASCKKHLQKSESVIDHNTMQESLESQPENPRGASDLLDDEVRVCDTCGDLGREELLAFCEKCTDGAAHIYCMRVKLDKVPEGGWTCEECMLRIDTEKAEQDKVEEAPGITKGHQECQKSSSGSKLKFRSSSPGKSRKNGASKLSAKRHAVPVEAQSGKRPRVAGTSVVPPRLSSKSSNSSSPCADISGKNLRKGKMKSTKGKAVASVPQFSSDNPEKAKAPHAFGDKRHLGIIEAELEKKPKALETRDVSSKTSKSSKSKLSEKEKLEVTDDVTSVKQSSLGTQGKAESSSVLVDKSSKQGSKSGLSQDKCPLLKSRSSEAVDMELKGQLEKGSCSQEQEVATNGADDGCMGRKDSRMVSKSLSLNVSSNKSNATSLEIFLDCVSNADALNELSYAKETTTTNRRAADSEVRLASSCPVALKKSNSAKKTKKNKRKEKSDLDVPIIQVFDNEQDEKETEYGDKTSLLGSTCQKAARRIKKDKRAADSEIHKSASSSVALKKLSCAKETKTDKRNETSDLHIPITQVFDSGVVSVQGEKETENGDQISLSGFTCHKAGACIEKDKRAADSEIHLVGSSRPVTLKKLSRAKKTKRDKRNETSDLHIPIIQVFDSPQAEKETEYGDKASLSDSTCHKAATCIEKDERAADSVVHLASVSCPVALKKLSCATETDKRKETSDLHIPITQVFHSGVVSVQDEKETEYGDKSSGSTCHKAAACIEKDKLRTDHARVEISLGTDLAPYAAAILSQRCVIPKLDYIWLGQFLILSSERLANYCDGVQAHISDCASPKVLELVDKFPKMIKLDELPRLGMWPSQFVESQATEENIALYFFAEDLESYRTYYKRLLDHMTKNDLALKGNLDGMELLIFPSSVLPKDSQRWNQSLFLWGVFRGRRVTNLTSVQMKISEKQENGDGERKQTLDVIASINNGTGEVDEIENTDAQITEETSFLYGNGCCSGLSDPTQAVEETENRSESQVAYLDVSLWPNSPTPSDGIVENNADANNGGPSESSFDFEWEYLEPLERQAVETLASLSEAPQKVSF